MISGLLAPSTANFLQRPTHIACKVTTTTTAAVKENEEQERKTESGGRSAAIERAYVHDVYENCDEPAGSIRPRVAQFLASLDPGNVVCDVGSGNGRYLNACNPFIYTIGVDRCYRLTKLAKSKGGEVALCDNLELPFRDESFDAVLSLAVIHHFATTERRVGAIRELARILRIGGRVVITVWALEQKHRRFESQDVLIPWQPSRNRTNSDDEDEDDFLPPYHAYTEDSTNSSRSAGDGDSSSLSSSSPGESCYSFVRKTIQKLAGGKRHPWFLDPWNSKENKNENSLDFEDAKDLPIELRRLDDFDDLIDPPLSANLKSRSLGSILNPPPQTIVRSQSSVPSLAAQTDHYQMKSNCNVNTNVNPQQQQQQTTIPETVSSSGRPKLVKQKQSLCDDNTFFDFNEIQDPAESRTFLRKQSSLNEEFMAENRLKEKERIRKRIQKQMSLNEAFLCRSIFTKRLQVIRELSTKIKTSTGSMERLKNNGIVKMIQNLKMSQTNTKFNGTNEETRGGAEGCAKPNVVPGSSGPTGSNGNNENDEEKPRRRSRESGSDSSKDSSLQSDTSIESEDSFASVIYIPRPEQQQQMNDYSKGHSNSTLANSGSNSSTNSFINTNSKMPSVPTSPLIMPCPTPAHSPAPIPGHPQCQAARKSGSTKEIKKFTFDDIKIADNTTEDLLNNSNKSILAKTIRQSEVRSTASIKEVVKSVRTRFEIPAIPKFGGNSGNGGSEGGSGKKRIANFPILRRSSAAPAVPKLDSLEIFNPEIDDVDSDSSEPSSPDSIDSVINALNPNQSGSNNSTAKANTNATDSTTDQDNNSDSRSKSDEDQSGVSEKSHESPDHQQTLVEFAKQLSAQLMKEIDENKDLSPVEDICKEKRTNGERTSLREELRGRRLMLANLSQSSSNLKRFHQFSEDIQEEDESYSNTSGVENDNSQSSSQLHQMESLEDDRDWMGEVYVDKFNKYNLEKDGSKSNKDDLEAAVPLIENVKSIPPEPDRPSADHQVPVEPTWRTNSSTGSLESPTVGGGSATHHRFYHVFREGELDALINHHVASLHIVSSYYERASWCVVAEKVHVWTI